MGRLCRCGGWCASAELAVGSLLVVELPEGVELTPEYVQGRGGCDLDLLVERLDLRVECRPAAGEVAKCSLDASHEHAVRVVGQRAEIVSYRGAVLGTG